MTHGPAPLTFNGRDARNFSRKGQRRGCRHCITCLKIERYCHSLSTWQHSHRATVEWWPGGIHSPIVYFHLRQRQLQHQIKYVGGNSKLWKSPSLDSATSTESISQRRQYCMISIFLPVTCTNVAHNDGRVLLVGVKTLHVSRGNCPTQVYNPPIVLASYKNVAVQDSKRRCTMYNAQTIHGNTIFSSQHAPDTRNKQTSETIHKGVEIAPSLIRPSPFVSPSDSRPVFPGRLVHNTSIGGSSNIHSKDVKIAAPLGDKNLNRYESPYSTLSNLLHKSKNSSPTSDQTSSQSDDDVCTTIPLLSLKSDSMRSCQDDPIMQNYHNRQYEIKKEQAFHCQTIDISDITKSTDKEEGVWTAMFRSFTSSFGKS